MATAPAPAPAPKAAPAPAPAEAAAEYVKPVDGDKIYVTAAIRDQVNDWTAQRIPHGAPTRVIVDGWIRMQLEAGVLTEMDA